MHTLDTYLQAIVAVFVITDPITRPIFFALLTQEMDKSQRRAAAFKVIGAVAAILFGAALFGKIFLDVIGIHLGAFGFIGGLIVAFMGLEMLMSGQPSKAQGGDASRKAPSAEDQLIVPFSMPFIAGPGAITVVITIASGSGSSGSLLTALVAVAFSIGAMMLTFTHFTDYLAKISEQTMAIVSKFGGLLIATIGTQLALNGLKSFFEIGG